MAKLKEKDIYNICIKKEETEKLLDYENNKGHFKNEDLNSLLSSLFLFVSKSLTRSTKKSKLIIEDNFISNVIKIYRKYLFTSKEDIRVVLKMLSEYKYNVIALKLNNELNDKGTQKKYIALATSQIKEINDFLSELHLKEKMYEELKEFDEFIETNKPLDIDSYNKLSDIFKYAVYPIPQIYVDLFFKNTISQNKFLSIDILHSLIDSLVSNYAYSNETFCYFRFRNMSNKSYGTYENNLILVEESHYKEIKRKKDYSNFLNTIFHELRHLYQVERITKVKALSYEEIIMMMDYLMYNALPKRFYEDNYNFLYTELDGRIHGRMYADCYLATLGVESNLSKENDKDIMQHKMRYRKLDGKFYIVDELFQSKLEEVYGTALDNGIDIFKRHPVLNLMYTRDCKRRTTLELFKMREEFIERSKRHEGENKDRLEILIHNINEILYKQVLSVEDTIKDYEELVKDDTIDSEEKRKYLENMLKVIEIRGKKEDIDNIKKLVDTIKKLISKNNKKEKTLSKRQQKLKK